MEASDFLEQCMEDMTRPWKEVVSEVLSMIQYGHAPMELTYKLRQGDVEEPYKDSKFDDGYVGWQSIALRSQDTILKWEFFENGEIKGLWQLAPPFYKLTYIPWEKFLLFRTDYSKNNPEGKSILRAAFRPWMYKKHLEEIEAIGAERGVSGIPIAWVPANIAAPDSADTAAVNALQAYKDLVKNIRRDSQEGIVFPLMYNDKGDKMFDLTLLTTAGSETGKIGEMIERKSREILQVCLAEFIMLGAGKTGSFALSQTKVDLFLQAIGAYLDLIEEVFNTNAVPRLFELNPQFKCDELPKIRHADIKDMDLNNMGNYVAKLIGAGAIQPDDELSNYLRQAAGLPEALEELEVIGPREQAEMQQQQFQMGLEAKTQAAAGKEGKDAKPSKKEPKPEEEEKPAGTKGKEVEKWIVSDNTRGNRLHDEKTGRFASTSYDMSYEEWKAQREANKPDYGPDQPAPVIPPWQQQPQTATTPEPKIPLIYDPGQGRGNQIGPTVDNPAISLAGFFVLESVLDNQRFDNTLELALATQIDQVLKRFKVKSANTLIFGDLPTEVFGQTKYTLNMYDGQIISDQSITIDTRQTEGVRRLYDSDQVKIKAGKLPWGASSYAKDVSGATGAIAVHEAAHAKMVEYTAVKPRTEWVDQQDAAQGTLAWKRTVDGAAEGGWIGPSEYAMTSYGEMFAESVTMYGEKGSTGSQTVDSFITRVVDA
jgi:hypothetical protein